MVPGFRKKERNTKEEKRDKYKGEVTCPASQTSSIHPWI
jgi:hypothetical protein